MDLRKGNIQITIQNNIHSSWVGYSYSSTFKYMNFAGLTMKGLLFRGDLKKGEDGRGKTEDGSWKMPSFARACLKRSFGTGDGRRDSKPRTLNPELP